MAHLRVGEWEVDPALNELRRGGEAIRLEPKAIEVLRYLAERPGEVVGREALLSAIWPGVVVGDDALTQAIIKLRRALGDDAHSPRYIETISKRGYRLIAAAGTSPGDPPAAPAGNRVPTRSRKKLAIAAAVILSGVAVAVLVAGVSGRWPIAPDSRSSLAASSPPTSRCCRCRT